MSTQPFWETPLEAISRFSERIVQFEYLDYLPWKVRKYLSGGFWVYHYIVLVFALMEKNQILDSGTTIVAIYPLVLFYGLYLIHFMFIYLPIGVLCSLYNYLKNKDLQPSHAILISLLTIIGAVFVVEQLINFRI